MAPWNPAPRRRCRRGSAAAQVFLNIATANRVVRMATEHQALEHQDRQREEVAFRRAVHDLEVGPVMFGAIMSGALTTNGASAAGRDLVAVAVDQGHRTGRVFVQEIVGIDIPEGDTCAVQAAQRANDESIRARCECDPGWRCGVARGLDARPWTVGCPPPGASRSHTSRHRDRRLGSLATQARRIEMPAEGRHRGDLVLQFTAATGDGPRWYSLATTACLPLPGRYSFATTGDLIAKFLRCTCSIERLHFRNLVTPLCRCNEVGDSVFKPVGVGVARWHQHYCALSNSSFKGARQTLRPGSSSGSSIDWNMVQKRWVRPEHVE